MNKVFLILGIFFLVGCSSTDNTDDQKTPEQKKAEIYYNEGTRNLIDKSYTEALTNLLKAKESNPQDSKIRTNLAMALYFRGQKEMALGELEEAISLDSKNTDAHVNISTILMENKKYKKAKEHLILAEKDLIYPGLFRVYYNLGILELKLGDRKTAFKYLEKSVTEKSDFCAGHIKLGQLYTEEMRFKEANKEFNLSIEGVCVNEAAPHYFLAQSLLNLNRYEEAKIKYQFIIEKFPKSDYKNLAMNSLKKLNQSEEIEQFSKNNEIDINQDDTTIETPNF